MAANIEDIISETERQLPRESFTKLLDHEDELALSQAAVFIEDAFKYRSIHHKIDRQSLRLYKVYYSKCFQWSLYLVIFTVLCLAFVERPSSLSWSSDPRPKFNNERIVFSCGTTESLELVCLVFFLVDLFLKLRLFGRKHFLRSKWLLGYCFVLVLSFLDSLVTLNLGCNERYRIRRMFRPFFLLQSSSLMKKTVRAIGRTVPQILSVFFLLFIHLLIFTILGMVLFPWPELHSTNINGTNFTTHQLNITSKDNHYFKRFPESLMKLLVLLTTANNPDVMMPVYKENRLYAIYFIVFTFIGLYCFMNLLLAVIYSQFQGYLKNSLQASYFRLRTGVRAAFEVLRERTFDAESDIYSQDSRTVSTLITRRLIQRVDFGGKNIDIVWDILDRNNSGQLIVKEFQELFDSISKQSRTVLWELIISQENVRQRQPKRPPLSHCTNRYARFLQKMAIHRYFNYFGLVVAALNAILISVELSVYFGNDKSTFHSPLAAVNFFFVVYYLLEQCLKLWAVGWQRYISHKRNIFDGLITSLLVVAQIVDIALNGSPLRVNYLKRYTVNERSTRSVIKVINTLIILRLVRIISSIKSLSVVTSTLGYLLKSLKPFAGVIVAVYYMFAIFGMMIFENAIMPGDTGNKTDISCGSYEQLEYWANNFNDFAASLVVLWDAMVVNNWHIFLHAYARYTSSWSQLFFVLWYLISVVICVNLFVALLLDVFIDRWHETQQREKDCRNRDLATRSLTQSYMVDRQSFRVHEMFRGTLSEPTEDEVMRELVYHGFTFRSNPSPSPRTMSTTSSNYNSL